MGAGAQAASLAMFYQALQLAGMGCVTVLACSDIIKVDGMGKVLPSPQVVLLMYVTKDL
jgi:hypothetical protein